MSVNCEGRGLCRGHNSWSAAYRTPSLLIRLTRLGIKEDHTANYFSHNNERATQSRDELAQDSLEMLIKWLKEGGNVGIHGELSITRSSKVIQVGKTQRIAPRAVGKLLGMTLVGRSILLSEPRLKLELPRKRE